jgi:hypothetical protein
VQKDVTTPAPETKATPMSAYLFDRKSFRPPITSNPPIIAAKAQTLVTASLRFFRGMTAISSVYECIVQLVDAISSANSPNNP